MVEEKRRTEGTEGTEGREVMREGGAGVKATLRVFTGAKPDAWLKDGSRG